MCVFLYLLHTEYQNTHTTSKVQTLLDILAVPPNLRLGFKARIKFKVRIYSIHIYIYLKHMYNIYIHTEHVKLVG